MVHCPRWRYQAITRGGVRPIGGRCDGAKKDEFERYASPNPFNGVDASDRITEGGSEEENQKCLGYDGTARETSVICAPTRMFLVS